MELFSKYYLHDLALNNRMVMAPMTRARAGKQRTPNNTMKQYYTQRAGAGLIVTEATDISPQAAGRDQCPGIHSDEQVSGWRDIVDEVHRRQGKIVMQLNHCGRISDSSFLGGNGSIVAPSAIAIDGVHYHTANGTPKAYETPKALTADEITALLDDYHYAAQRAKQAGFDGVEIAASYGNLIDTFIQSTTNLRSDQYGGNTANRIRFLLQVIDAVGSVFPLSRVGVRISPNSPINDMGCPDFRETFLDLAAALNDFSLAYLHIVDGLSCGFHELGPQLQLTEFRQVFSGTLIGNGGYNRDSSERAIANRQADLIAYGLLFINNPDLPERFLHDLPLNPPAEFSYFYQGGSKGYIDFPTFQQTVHSFDSFGLAPVT